MLTLTSQEARYSAAMIDLRNAEEELAEKNRELAVVQAKYDAAMKEKQVRKVAFLMY